VNTEPLAVLALDGDLADVPADHEPKARTAVFARRGRGRQERDRHAQTLEAATDDARPRPPPSRGARQAQQTRRYPQRVCGGV